jgi:hypothetical protein
VSHVPIFGTWFLVSLVLIFGTWFLVNDVANRHETAISAAGSLLHRQVAGLPKLLEDAISGVLPELEAARNRG